MIAGEEKSLECSVKHAPEDSTVMNEVDIQGGHWPIKVYASPYLCTGRPEKPEPPEQPVQPVACPVSQAPRLPGRSPSLWNHPERTGLPQVTSQGGYNRLH